MNSWEGLRKKQQAEVNAFPLHFAFGKEQTEQKITELGLDPERLDEQIVSIGGGGFVLKQDAPALQEMLERHAKEREDAIAEDKTGDGIIYDMFYYELLSNEYGYTLSTEDTLKSLGYTEEEVEADPRLKHGLEKAAGDIREKEGFSW